jgi:hypothetical protein
MIITNNIDSVYISVIEDVIYANATYAVYKINVAGQVNSEASLTGVLDVNNTASFKLLDGSYIIVINSFNNNAPVIEQDFIVLYNYLPTLIKYVKDAVCDCDHCTEKDKLEKLQKNFFNTIMFLSCKGILYNLPFVLTKNCEVFNILKSEDEKREYYGIFNFDYEEKIKEFFIALYLDLHYNYVNSLKDTPVPEAQSLLNVFEVENIKRCMYSLGLDLDTQICNLTKMNCGYDGL